MWRAHPQAFISDTLDMWLPLKHLRQLCQRLVTSLPQLCGGGRIAIALTGSEDGVNSLLHHPHTVKLAHSVHHNVRNTAGRYDRLREPLRPPGVVVVGRWSFHQQDTSDTTDSPEL